MRNPLFGMALAPLLLASPVWADDAPGALMEAGTVAKDPGRYYGRFVHVKAEVEKVYGTQMFTLDEDELFVGPDVLVLIPDLSAARVKEGEEVVVGGMVRRYSEVEFERDYDFFERGHLVDVQGRVEWNTRPVIIASSVQSASRNELLAPLPAKGSGAPQSQR